MQEITPRQGLNTWPVFSGQDPSSDTAYMALMHFEGDEDRHKEELFYVDAQLEHLKLIADTLACGEALPDDVCKQYLNSPITTGHWKEWGLFLQPVSFFKGFIAHQYNFVKTLFDKRFS